MRKVIHTSIAETKGPNNQPITFTIATCNDGSMWYAHAPYAKAQWTRLPDVPQDEEVVTSPSP